MKKKLPAIVLLSILLPAISLAATTPRALMHKGSTNALNNSIYSFNVPTFDSAGKVKYYDVIIDIDVNTNGTIAPTANVTSTINAPIQPRGNIPPGTYKSAGAITDTCTVINLPISTGRTESAFNCNNSSFTFSIISGSVSTGHPFLADLLSGGVNLLSNVTDMAWGRYTNGGTHSLGGCYLYSPIGVRSFGNQLIISTYPFGTNTRAPVLSCSVTINKVP